MDNWTSEIQIRQLQVNLHPVLFKFIQTNFNFNGQFILIYQFKKGAEGMRGLPHMKVAHTRFMRGLLHKEAAHDARPVPMDSRAYCAKDKSFENVQNF